MSKINLNDIIEKINGMVNDEADDVFERKNPWTRHGRKLREVRSHIRVTRHGTEVIDPFLHPYPEKIKEGKKGRVRRRKPEEKAERKRRIGEEKIKEGKQKEKKTKEEAINELMSCYI